MYLAVSEGPYATTAVPLERDRLWKLLY
jgi:hypothetical protein